MCVLLITQDGEGRAKSLSAEMKPSSCFRIFRTPTHRWSWTLLRSDAAGPLARGPEFSTKEEAVANTLRLREALLEAGWSLDAGDELADERPSPARWAEVIGPPICAAPGCFEEATAVVEGGLVIRRGIERHERAWCEEHARLRLDWGHLEEQVIKLTSDIVVGERPQRRSRLRRRKGS